jgi:hypothetical protein
MRNYSEFMWDEWNHRSIDNPLSAKTEIAGIYTALASKNRPENIVSSRPWIYRRIQKLWAQSEWESETPFAGNLLLPEKGNKKKITFTFPEKRLRELDEINQKIFQEGRRRFPLWLGGLWGGGGRQYFPQNGYYLLIRLPETPLIPEIITFLQNSEETIRTFCRIRHGKAELMIREIQSIYSFFVTLRLPLTALRFDEIAVLRSMRNQANKIVNCDNANIKKTLRASEYQIAFCKEAQRLGLDAFLSPEIGELISLRIENPTLSLREIGTSMKKSVSKSTVEYRLKKIEKLVLQNSSNLLKK